MDDEDWNATIEQSIAAHGLHLNYFPFFCETRLLLLKDLVSLSPKAKFEKYSEILQTSFGTVQITEMVIKRLLVKVVNSVLFNNDISNEDSQIDFAVPTNSYKKIVTYLAVQLYIYLLCIFSCPLQFTCYCSVVDRFLFLAWPRTKRNRLTHLKTFFLFINYFCLCLGR